MKQVVVFAGTNEGRKLCEYLAQNRVEVLAVVATEYGSLVLPDMPFLSVKEGRLPLDEIINLVGQYEYIVDATHPYARIISENIAEAVKRSGKKSIRLIRPSVEYENVLEFPNIADACEYLNGTAGNILATTGSKELLPYAAIENYRERVFVRVLSTVEAISACTDAGFKATNVICMHGPFSENMNAATMEQIKAKFIVTKETGKSGGFIEKISAARKLGVQVILVGRPCREEGLTLEETYKYFKNEFKTVKKSFSHFPLFFDLKDKKIVVIGGGLIAARRIEVLRSCGAEIILIAKKPADDLKRLADGGEIKLLERSYEEGDLQGAFMAMAATDNRDVNEKVYTDAREAGIAVNVCDKKEQCDFYFPAVFEDEKIIGGLISKEGKDHQAVKEAASRIRECLKNRREQK